MNIIDAINLMDEVAEGDDYGKVIIESKSLMKYLVNSKYGICQCGNDWPYAYRAHVEDFKVNDWEISH
jgi:hypothetical protein